MADEELSDRGYLRSKQGGPTLESHHKMTRRVNGATHQVGYVVSLAGETPPDLALGITTLEHAIGVIDYPTDIEAVLQEDPNWTADDVIPDNADVEVIKLGSGAIMALKLEATAGPVAVAQGDKIVMGTEAGKVRRFLYTDAASETDTLEELVGYAAEAHAGHATEDRQLLVELR